MLEYIVNGWNNAPQVNGWWLVIEAYVCFALMLWFRFTAYRHGIWDGAFNHFLPVVRKEMMFYAPNRAADIFAEEEQYLYPVTKPLKTQQSEGTTS